MKWTLKGSLSSGQVHTDAVIVPVTKNKRRKAAFPSPGIHCSNSWSRIGYLMALRIGHSYGPRAPKAEHAC